MKKKLFALAASMLLLTGCSSQEQTPELLEPALVQPDTAVVIVDTVEDVRCLEGRVVPELNNLYFTSDGTVGEVYVSLGSQVKAGDVLARLDVSYYETMAKSLQATITNTKSANYYTNVQSECDITIAELTYKQMQENGADEKSLELQEIYLEGLRSTYTAQLSQQSLALSGYQRQLDSYQQAIDSSTIAAGCDGTVVSVAISPGGWVFAYGACITVANDAERLIACEYIETADLNGAAEIYATVDGVRAEVENLPYSRTEYLSLSAGGNLNSRFRITDGGKDAANGMSAYVFIVSGRSENTLVVPANAVRTEGGERFVYLINGDGTQTRKNVRVGIVTAALAEITDGVSEGDVVYVGK